MADKLLDDSLIDSDVCIRCAHCCKSTSSVQYAHPNAKEWIDVLHDTPNLEVQWHNPEMTEQVKSDGSKVKQMAVPYHVTTHCTKLVIDEAAGTRMCGIYEDRPAICRNYNCFTTANRSKRRPQNWDKIKRIIQEVHGVTVEWTLPLKKVNWKVSEVNHIPFKEID